MINIRIFQSILLAALIVGAATTASADSRDIGAISTEFKLLGPNHKIVVSAFNDPKIDGVTCYVARPKVGGIKGGLGLAEDPSIVSVSCAQTGPIVFKDKIETGETGEEVFDEKRSIIFKTLRINRLYDGQTGALVYVARTIKILNGSPLTAVSVVAPISWNGVAAQKPVLK